MQKTPMTKERWERVKQIFESALGRQPEERADFVAQTCADDSSLYQEVNSLLSAHSEAVNFLAKPAAAHFPVDENRPAPQRTFQPGELVSGRFKILRFLGEGGMGQVYEAEDCEVGSRIALKTIRPEIASDPGILARFKQEFQLTRLITHLNICRTFDLARHHVSHTESAPSKDVTYLTMELLEGETLAERLRRGRMTPHEALPLIRQMANALAAAHSAGVIHRDFKPGNVILCRGISGSPPATRVVVTDFGLARTWSSAEGISQSLGGSGQIIGTLAYMAPEQLEGRKVTPASDIYAFGLVIYEMVTGSQPFHSDSALAGAIQRLTEPPASPRAIVPELNQEWESTILRCLRIAPSERFHDVIEVCDALAGKAVPAAPGRLRKLSLGHGRWEKLSLAAIPLLALVAWGAWSARHRWFPSNASIGLEFSRLTLDTGVNVNPAISPDGRVVAYSSDRSGNGIRNIWIRSDVSATPSSVPPFQVTHETSHAVDPAISPDGSQIAFRSDGDGRIYLISSRGENKRLLAFNGRKPQFSPDGRQIAFWSGDWTGDASRPSFRPTGKIFIIPVTGGSLTQLAKDFADARSPTWSPDGSHLLFQGTRNPVGSVMESSDWWVIDLTRPDTPPFQTGAFPALRRNSIIVDGAAQWWGESIVFPGTLKENTNLFQFHISNRTWQVNGEPLRLTRSAEVENDPAISQNGRLVYSSSRATINIWALPLETGIDYPAKEANLVQLTEEESEDARPSISMNGQRLAFSRMWETRRNLWLKDLPGNQTEVLASHEVVSPVINHAGSQVAYSLFEKPKSPIEIVERGTATKRVCVDCGEPLDWSYDDAAILYSAGPQRAIGLLELVSGQPKLLLRSANLLSSASFGPHDEYVLFVEWIDNAHSRIWLAPMRNHLAAPNEQWVPLTDGRYADDTPRASADGRSIYFESNRDGFDCIWLLNLSPSFESVSPQPIPALHLHRASFGLGLSHYSFNLRVAADKLVFNAVSKKSSLVMTQIQSK